MQKNMEAKKEEEINYKNFFLFKTLFYFLLQITGISAGLRIKQLFLKNNLGKIKEISVLNFLISFAIATIILVSLIYLIKKQSRKNIIFLIIYIIAICFGASLWLSLWIGDLKAIVILVLLLFFQLKMRIILFQNILMLLGISGIAAIFGLRINPISALFLLLILSFYDFIAVYKTKHMVKIAKEMLISGNILGIVIPDNLPALVAKIKRNCQKRKQIIIGGGDFILPLIFSISFLKEGLLKSLIISIFGFFGLAFSFLIFVSQQEKKPIPALPPITLFCIFGYLLSKFL